MMHYLNTLFVTTQGAYLSKEGDAVVVSVEREVRLRVPLHNLGGIVCFGQVTCTPPLMGECSGRQIAISFLTESGKFLARVQGYTPGNVLLRREQYRRADDDDSSTKIARQMIAAKILNSRVSVLRTLRDNPEVSSRSGLESAERRLARIAGGLEGASSLDQVRGEEGEAGRVYFGIFDHLILAQKSDFKFEGRNRRPPLDTVNALLSFAYSLLTHDARAACEACGLDPDVGFLHRDRPGRPSLALDLIEELRPFLADRLVLTLINRQQVRAAGFRKSESGAVAMDDDTRKKVLVAYQQRKQEVIVHPFLEQKCAIGLVVHLQARLLARHLRGDGDGYPPFLWK